MSDEPDEPELAAEPEPSSDPAELDEPDDEPDEALEPLEAAAVPEGPVVLACDDPGST